MIKIEIPGSLEMLHVEAAAKMADTLGQEVIYLSGTDISDDLLSQTGPLTERAKTEILRHPNWDRALYSWTCVPSPEADVIIPT